MFYIFLLIDAECLDQRVVGQGSKTVDIGFVFLPVKLCDVDDACRKQGSDGFRWLIDKYTDCLDAGG